MSSRVIAIHQDSSVEAGVRMMAKRDIGSVVVRDDSGPVGIFTERDLLNKILGPGENMAKRTMGDVTARRFNTVRPDQGLRAAAGVMTSTRGRLAVFDDEGSLIGIITASDIVRAIHAQDTRFYIDHCVTKRVVVVGAETRVGEVIGLMDKRRIGSVLVEDRKGEPTRIFTERDLLKRVLLRNLPMSTPVRDVSSLPLVTGPPGLGGYEAATIMVTKRIKRLPLSDGGLVVGIVTARDIVKACCTS